MANATLHVCNATREAPLCKRVDILDTAHVPFNTFVKHLTQISETGLFLRPFWGIIPRMPGLPAVEILLLSEELVVLECLAELPKTGVGDADPRIASALILPGSTIAAAHVKAGDRIRICDAESRVAWDCRNDKPSTSGPQCRCFLPQLEVQEAKMRTAQVQAAISSLRAAQNQANRMQADAAKKKSLRERIVHWITGYDPDGDRRRGPRRPSPKLVAYYWTGGTPKAFNIGDIGPTGFYLITEDRWVIGTQIVMTLQRTDMESEDSQNSITVPSMVIHSGSDGVGFAFAVSVAVNAESGEIVPANKQDHERLMRFLEGVSHDRLGIALVNS